MLERVERLMPADHQTHRRFEFAVPDGTRQLRLHVRYQPKFISAQESSRLVASTIAARSAGLAAQVGQKLAHQWEAYFEGADLRVPNLLTISLDDAKGAYRGAGHRHAAEQELSLSATAASPGLIAGDLPPGRWTLTVTAHTLVSVQCELEIQIGAEIA